LGGGSAFAPLAVGAGWMLRLEVKTGDCDAVTKIVAEVNLWQFSQVRINPTFIVNDAAREKDFVSARPLL